MCPTRAGLTFNRVKILVTSLVNVWAIGIVSLDLKYH